MTHETRLSRLQTLWPVDPCPACAVRPAVVCIEGEEDPAPAYPEGRCPACGRLLYSVPVLVGVDCDAI